MVDYEYIENLLAETLRLSRNFFEESEVAEVQEFLDVGEYGLALDTLIGIIEEEQKQIPQEVIEGIKKSAIAMDLEVTTIEKKLKGHLI